jgi:hypothetical protein
VDYLNVDRRMTAERDAYRIQLRVIHAISDLDVCRDSLDLATATEQDV